LKEARKRNRGSSPHRGGSTRLHFRRYAGPVNGDGNRTTRVEKLHSQRSRAPALPHLRPRFDWARKLVRLDFTSGAPQRKQLRPAVGFLLTPGEQGGRSMSPEPINKDPILARNEQVVRRFIDAWAALDVDAAVACLAPDIVYINQPLEPVVGLNDVRKIIKG